MSEITMKVNLEQFTQLQVAMDIAPDITRQEIGRAFYKIGKSDIEKMKSTGLQNLNLKRQALAKSFKFFASDARKAKSIDEMVLKEWSGAKPLKIFQTGGDITPSKAGGLTVLTPAARYASGKRKYTQKELVAMIQNGQARIQKTKAGPAIVLVEKEKKTKKGKTIEPKKLIILAWIKKRVHEDKKIDFFANYDSNESYHIEVLNEAMDRVTERLAAPKVQK